MSHMHTGNSANPGNSDDSNPDELERLLVEGVSLSQAPVYPVSPASPLSQRENDDEDEEVLQGGDVQGAIGLFAEAAQDMATAGVELGLGRHFACADFCNQAVEKAAQAVSLLRFGRKSMYDHDLGKLGALVGAPQEIQDEMAILTPFHPESFYADTPPEEADDVINAEQANSYLQSARRVLRWARNIVLIPL
ncbi:MAG: HEPN domain-containing protein [Ktedonobacteraceae bacterium]